MTLCDHLMHAEPCAIDSSLRLLILALINWNHINGGRMNMMFEHDVSDNELTYHPRIRNQSSLFY